MYMNSAVAAQLDPPPTKMQGYSTGVSHTAKQKKSLYSGTVAHMKSIT